VADSAEYAGTDLLRIVDGKSSEIPIARLNLLKEFSHSIIPGLMP
jgi:hypothetical protein